MIWVMCLLSHISCDDDGVFLNYIGFDNFSMLLRFNTCPNIVLCLNWYCFILNGCCWFWLFWVGLCFVVVWLYHNYAIVFDCGWCMFKLFVCNICVSNYKCETQLIILMLIIWLILICFMFVILIDVGLSCYIYILLFGSFEFDLVDVK